MRFQIGTIHILGMAEARVVNFSNLSSNKLVTLLVMEH